MRIPGTTFHDDDMPPPPPLNVTVVVCLYRQKLHNSQLFCYTDVLMAKRTDGTSYAGYYGLPGGSLEPNEDMIECAVREVMEETAIKLTTKDFTGVSFLKKTVKGKHYTIVRLWAKIPDNQTPRQTEPAKHGPWEWFDVREMPSPMFEDVTAPDIGFPVKIE